MFWLKSWNNYKFFIIIIFLGLVSLITSFSRLEDLSGRNRDVRENIKRLTHKNKTLYEKQRRLQTDPVYIESVARQKLNMAKEGESVFQINPQGKE